MPGMVKYALVALVALVTASLMSLAPAHADDSTVNEANEARPAVAEQAERFTAAKAKAAYRNLKNRVAKERQRRGTARPITYLPRIKSLPRGLRAPMESASLRDRNRDKRIDSTRITFRAGSHATASCLDLRSGKVTPGTCKQPIDPASSPSLVVAYKAIVHTAIWFDQRSGIYGKRARDIALMRLIETSEVPTSYTLTYADTDGDRRVDDGMVTLINTETGSCGTIVLPDTGNLNASMIHC